VNLILLLFLFLTGCSSASFDSEEISSIANKDQKIDYSAHPCSKEDNGRIRAYGFFESVSSSSKILALVNISLGWVNDEDTAFAEKGVIFEIEKLQIQNLEDWKDDHFSLSLRLRDTESERVVEGEPVDTYTESVVQTTGVLDSVNKEFQISNQGNFDFELSNEEGEYQYIKHSIYIYQNQIQNLNSEHQLFLVLRNQSSRRELSLLGPLLLI